MTDDDFQAPLPEGIRINKYLALCGYESRRKADQLIADGAVEVNGQRVEAPGARVMPGDYVKVNGKHALPKEEISILLNKPKGAVCSRDAQGAEATVYDLLPAKYRYVNYVGRLDTDSEGLLILTNKGELSQRLAHPSAGVEKEYWVTLNQPYENSVLVQLLKGVRIPEGQAKAKFVSRLSPRRACVVLEQGLKRQVRQMFACLGFRVRKLVRVRIGSLWGGDLAPGRAMLLTAEQEKLATTNPAPRKGLVGAAQVFPGGGSVSQEQVDKALDEKAARKALEEETDYKFNPADFESDEEAAENFFRDWDAEDAYRDTPAERGPGRRRGGVQRGYREGSRPAFHGRREDRFRRDAAPDRRFRRGAAPERGEGRFRRKPWEQEERADGRGFPRKRDFRSFDDEQPARRPRRPRGEERSEDFGRAPRRFNRDAAGDRGFRSRRPAPRSQGGRRSGGFGAQRRSSFPRGKRF